MESKVCLCRVLLGLRSFPPGGLEIVLDILCSPSLLAVFLLSLPRRFLSLSLRAETTRVPGHHVPERLPQGLPVLHGPVRGEVCLPEQLQERVSPGSYGSLSLSICLV